MTTWDADRLQAEAPDSERADEISLKMQPFLKGLHPAEQGYILAELLAIWLAGHAAVTHERLLYEFISGVRHLLPLYIELNRGRLEG